jgi:hypothetical protein
MRRFLSIAICSCALVSQAWAIRVAHYYNGSFSKAGYFQINTAGNGTFASPDWTSVNPSLFQTNTTINVTSMYQSFLSVTNTFPAIGSVGGNEWIRVDFVYPTNATNQGSLRRWSQDPRTGGTQVGQTVWANGYAPDPVVTNAFSWTFGPEWAGTILQVKATNGTTLGTWGLPSVIGSNYVLSASIVTNQSLLTGAQVFLDGVSAATLASAGTNNSLNTFADRPGYELSFGADYQGGEWQIRRSDGSVAATGSAATLGTVASGRVTLLPEGSTGSIWTRVPAGDGMGAVWVNSGISVSGNNVTTFNFAAAPVPTPLPTPAFQTNAPAPTITNAPAATTPGTNTTTPAPVATNDVTVDVDQLQPIPTDDGEEAALDGVRNASEKLRGILEDFRGSFENVAFTFNEFRKFTLGGVGTTCTFTLGDVTINLANIVPSWLRSGLKLAILIVAVFSMIRYTWETFR